MPTATRTFRVFVSSTFEDLKDERDILQREVFPRLRKLCEANNARFQAIDLRWGVRDEAALDQQTMEICLREIARCQQTGIKPNFIVLLGERYGWRPLPARIEAGEFEQILAVATEEEWHRLLWDERPASSRGWYCLDLNADPAEYILRQREVNIAEDAAENKKKDARDLEADAWEHTEEDLRKIFDAVIKRLGWAEDGDRRIKYEVSATHQEILKGLGESAEERKHVFAFFRKAAESATEDEELAALKDDLRNKLPAGNVCPFFASDLAALCADVEAKLSAVILAEAGMFTSRDALEVEIEAHDRFAEERCRIFVGRGDALKAIENYLSGPERRPLVLHGASGSGKSAVMAKASQRYEGRVIRRFIGASPESASGHALLTSLCKQIAPGETPVDYAQLEKAFQERLATAEQPLVLFVDALDQLAASDPARAATWLPAELPAHVKVIVSTTDDGERLPQGLPLPLERMTIAEGGQALDELLRGADPKEQRRTLQPWQRDRVLEHFERCGLPLYLKLAAEESRLWKSFSPPDACRLGEGIAGVLDTLFDRLASNANHGPVLVERSLSYLAAARYGLTEDEMLDVLTADNVVWDDFDKKKHHEVSERRLPVVVWSRLSLDLEPYLTERATPGGTVIAFYHRQLAERVKAKYLAGDEAQERHTDLAKYFYARPPWLDEGRKAPNARRAAELVFQQRSARQWKEAEATLFDCPFLFAKIAAGMVLDLNDDYLALLKDAPESELRDRDTLRLMQGTLRLSLHVVAKDQRQFASQMRGRLLAHQDKPGIAAFLEGLDACTPRPRLRPLWPVLEAAGGPMLRVLEGHTGGVCAVALSADGKRAVSGSEDNTVRVWDLESNLTPQVLEGHSWWVNAVTLSADGKRAVSCSGKTMMVWYLENKQPPRVLEGHTDQVYGVALSADGSRAVSGSRDHTLRVWDLDGNQPPRVLAGHTEEVYAVALSSDGKRAVSGSSDKTVRVWDLEGNQPPRVLESLSTFGVHAVALSGDGKRVVSSSGSDLRVWDLGDNQPPHVLKGHAEPVHAVALSADGKRAVSGSSDKTVRVWDLEGNQPPRVLEGHTSRVRAVALSADGKRAVSASHDKTVRVWNLEGNQPPRFRDSHKGPVHAVALSGDGQRVVSGSNDDTLLTWDMEGNQPPHLLEGHTHGVRTVALSGDGQRAVSALLDRTTLRVWDSEGNQPPRILESDSNWVLAVALSGNGQRAVSGSFDSALLVWDLEGDELPHLLEGHTGPVVVVTLSADGKRAVSCSGKTMMVWDLEGNYLLRTLEGHTDLVMTMALSRHGQRAVSGSCDNTVRVWDLEGNQPPRILEGHTNDVHALALSDDGKRTVSGSGDHTLRVWDLETATCLAVFTCDAAIRCCAWGGERIVAGDESGKVHLFAWEE